MLLTNNTFANGLEYDLTNGQHEFPNLTLGQYDGATEDSMYQFEIWNYLTHETHMSFENLRQAVEYCNTHFHTNLKLA